MLRGGNGEARSRDEEVWQVWGEWGGLAVHGPVLGSGRRRPRPRRVAFSLAKVLGVSVGGVARDVGTLGDQGLAAASQVVKGPGVSLQSCLTPRAARTRLRKLLHSNR